MNHQEAVYFRIAQPFDAEVLSTLAAETFWDTYNGLIDHGDIWSFIRMHFTPEKIRQDINTQSGVYIICEDAQKIPVAYARLSTDYQPPVLKGKKALEVNKIYVVARVKRKGVGNQLMNYITDYARRLDFTVLWLAVWEHNKAAIAFYTKMGYKKVAEVPFAMGSETHNDYLVAKTL